MWLDGVLLCVFGSTLTALGLVLQKLSHRYLEQQDEKETTPYYRSPWWMFGFATWLSAQIINFIAMAMAPQVVLSCLGSWSLICNMIFAHLILGETIVRAQALAMVCLLFSVTIVIVNAPRPTNHQEIQGGDVEVVAAGFLRPDFDLLTACFLCIVVALRALAVGTSCVFRRKPSEDCENGNGSETETLAGTRGWPLQPISLAASSAVAAGYTALLFKCVAQVLVSSADEAADPTSTGAAVPSPWTFWQTYAIILSALLCAPTEVHLLNMALQCGDAVLVVPTYFALGMVSQLCTGAVFFQEFQDFQSRRDAFCFVFGVVLSLTFVVVMARVQHSEVEPDNESLDTREVAVQKFREFASASLPLQSLSEELLEQEVPQRRAQTQYHAAAHALKPAPLLQLGGVTAWAPLSPAGRPKSPLGRGRNAATM